MSSIPNIVVFFTLVFMVLSRSIPTKYQIEYVIRRKCEAENQFSETLQLDYGIGENDNKIYKARACVETCLLKNIGVIMEPNQTLNVEKFKEFILLERFEEAQIIATECAEETTKTTFNSSCEIGIFLNVCARKLVGEGLFMTNMYKIDHGFRHGASGAPHQGAPVRERLTK